MIHLLEIIRLSDFSSPLFYPSLLALFLLPQPPTAQGRSCRAGSKGLESQTSSLVTGGPNSPLLCGPAFVRFYPSHTPRLLPIILSPMASWSASTAA
jgi:hypothetical protein